MTVKLLVESGNDFADNSNHGDRAIFGGIVAGCAASFRAARRWIRAEANVAQAQGGGVTAVAAGEAASDARRMELLRDCDLVPAAGSRYFTESFAPHARRVLDTPAAGLRRGKSAAILSCGFEAVRGRALAERMLSVLPKLGRIVCREPPQSPDVLRCFGVPTDRMVIAGDGAIEFALARRPEVLGRGLASTCVAPTMPASGLPQSPTGARCCAARSLIWTR